MKFYIAIHSFNRCRSSNESKQFLLKHCQMVRFMRVGRPILAYKTVCTILKTIVKNFNVESVREKVKIKFRNCTYVIITASR